MSSSPRVEEDLCAITLGDRSTPPLLNVVSAEPGKDV